jgi:hypothetical protein
LLLACASASADNAPRRSGGGRIMRAVWGWLGLALAAAVAADTDDISNERPPTTPAQLERHWGVDCAALRDEVLAWTPAEPAAAHWLQALRLCAAIHNPPGVAPRAACPDYAAAAQALGQTPPASGSATTTPIRSSLECP